MNITIHIFDNAAFTNYVELSSQQQFVLHRLCFWQKKKKEEKRKLILAPQNI